MLKAVAVPFRFFEKVHRVRAFSVNLDAVVAGRPSTKIPRKARRTNTKLRIRCSTHPRLSNTPPQEQGIFALNNRMNEI